ncbi:MAG: SPOR domain-containing protein [Sphingomonadaceae bacterium]|nr:SPOR domain-containing protein [Sphingomonadaceae bacterium]
MMRFSACSLAAMALAVALPAPALADVKSGVDAWSRGDYEQAVKEWRGPAAAGDADAQFNMAQAYRLGRGVEVNAKQAEVYYAKAAAQGHIKAADNYGLMLFQDGRREEAMPYIKAASERGDPRAQYLLGIAHFNGDMVPKDWVRAYALLTLANSAGLPQAKPAIQQMDSFIPLAQRQEAQTVAGQIKAQADSKRGTQLAAADLGQGGSITKAAPPPPRPAQAAVLPGTTGRIPQPIQTTPVAPSIAAAEAAISEAQRVTGTGSPAGAGADYAGSAPAARPRPGRVSGVTTAAVEADSMRARAMGAPDPLPRPVAATPTPTPQPTRTAASGTAASGGPWKVQLGAFSVAGNADRMWNQLSGRAELAGASKVVVPAGRLTKLLAGGFSSRGEAQQACSALKAGGHSCLVTR